MKFLCDNCEKYPCDDNAIKLMKYCPVYSPKPKPQTNADHIRSMTDEELSSWINDHVDCNRRCEALKDGCMDSDSTCMAAWLEWLKEEAPTVIPADDGTGRARKRKLFGFRLKIQR